MSFSKKTLLVTLWLLTAVMLMLSGDIRIAATGNVLNNVNLYWRQPFPCGHPMTVTLQTNEGALTVWTCKEN